MTFQTRLLAAIKRATKFHRNIYLIYICAFFFGFLLFGGLFQVLVNLLLVRLGYRPEFIGLLNGLGQLLFSGGSVIGAVLGQRFSSITLIRWGFFLYFGSLFLFPLAVYLPESIQSGWLLVAYLLGFFMGTFYLVHMNPLMMVSTKDEERNSVFSYQLAIIAFGGFAGAWFAGNLSAFLIERFALSVDSPLPYAWTLLVGASLALIGVIAAFYLKDTHTQEHQPADTPKSDAKESVDAFPWKIILIVALVISLRIVGEQAARNFINLYLDLKFSVAPAQIAYIYSVAQLMSIPSTLIAPVLMTRYGRGNVFNWATIGIAGFVILSALAPHWLWITISYILILVLAQIARPAITIISMEAVTPKWRASMSSSNLIAIGLSGLVTSLMGGLMISSVGFTAFFVTAAVVTLAGVAVFWFNFLKDANSQR